MAVPSRALVATLALLGLFVALAVAGSPGGQRAASAQPEPTPAPGGPIPCDPHGERTIEPRVVEAGGEVAVRVTFDFTCSGEDRKINFFLVVENTSFMGGARNEALPNVKRGLTEFVNAVNYFNGSQGGLTLYADDYTNRVTLRGGAQGKEDLLHQIGLIRVEPVGDSAGAGAAIRDATERLPTGVSSDVTNVLVVVDAGAPEVNPPLIDVPSACGAAHNANVHVIVVGLVNAGNRYGFCATPSWFKYDNTTDASGFPAVMIEMADRLIKGQQAESTEYFEGLRQAVSIVPGSSQPFEPTHLFSNDWAWNFPGSLPPGGEEVTYRLKVTDDANFGNEIFSPSFESSLGLVYKNGPPGRYYLPLPEICVYKKGAGPGFCNGFPPEPSATPGGQTPTHTPEAPTEVPTTPPVPTHTPTTPPTVQTGHSVFLPVAGNKADLR